MRIDLMHGECLDKMELIPDSSIDMCLTDLPYGTTACKWDSVIPFEPMWKQLKRIVKPNGAICLFGSEPFSSALRMSNIKMFKYDWYWEKKNAPNFFVAKLQPLNHYENISVFSMGIVNHGKKEKLKYYPQGLKGINLERINSKSVGGGASKTGKGNDQCFRHGKLYKQTNTGYPRKNLIFAHDKGLHPTQKPVALLEYLIKTYTLESETVLDFTMGSGSTGVAAKNLDRNFIGIEKDETYFKIAKERIENSARI